MLELEGNNAIFLVVKKKKRTVFCFTTSIFNLLDKCMKNLLLATLLLSGIVFTFAVLLMSPKAWLWAGIWWMSSSGDYGSKKSVESWLKKAAIVSSIVFIASCVFFPFVD